jgi:esterase/lipase
MELDLKYVGGMWEKLKFLLPDHFNSSCCRMWLHIVFEKRTPLDSKPVRLFQITGFSLYFNISTVLVLSDHTKLITACCSTVMHSDIGVAILKNIS